MTLGWLPHEFIGPEHKGTHKCCWDWICGLFRALGGDLGEDKLMDLEIHVLESLLSHEQPLTGERTLVNI